MPHGKNCRDLDNNKLNMKKILFFLLISTAALSQPYNGIGFADVTGQGTQTASGNNIVLAVAGTGSYDAQRFNQVSISIIVTGTVSSGAVTFEASNDNTNFVAIPLFDEISPFGNPISTYNPLTGVNRNFNGTIHFRYFRARISTVIGGGGSLQAFTHFSNASYQPDITPITQDDQSVTGQAAQTATINNILTTTAGSAATDLSGFKSASVQVNSTGTSGNYIFEGSNDNSAFVAIPVWNLLILTGTPITAAVTASNTNIVYIFPVTTRYVRLRISGTIGGGSIQAISKFSQSPFAPGIQQVAQATAANFNATVSATNLSTNVAQMNGVAVTMGNGTSGTGVQRVAIASDNTSNTNPFLHSLAIPDPIADVTSAAITSTTTTSAFTPTRGQSYFLEVPVTVVTGTNPTYDLSIEESADGGTNWFKVWDFERVTSTTGSPFRSPILPDRGNRVRYVQTLSGTTPSFTRAISRIQSNAPATPRVRLIDRSISLTTLNSTSPVIQTAGASIVQLVVAVGAITTTAPQLIIEGSEESQFTNFYTLPVSALTAVASSTVQTTLVGVSAPYIRVKVSVAGVGVTANYIALKAF